MSHPSHSENVVMVTNKAAEACQAALNALPGPATVTVEYGGVKLTMSKGADIPATGVQTPGGLSHGDHPSGISLPNLPKLPDE